LARDSKEEFAVLRIPSAIETGALAARLELLDSILRRRKENDAE
jgi:hypothetical protein